MLAKNQNQWEVENKRTTCKLYNSYFFRFKVIIDVESTNPNDFSKKIVFWFFKGHLVQRYKEFGLFMFSLFQIGQCITYLIIY